MRSNILMVPKKIQGFNFSQNIILPKTLKPAVFKIFNCSTFLVIIIAKVKSTLSNLPRMAFHVHMNSHSRQYLTQEWSYQNGRIGP